MKKFLARIILFFVAFLLVNTVMPLIGLYKLHRDYTNPRLGSVKLIADKEASKNILVIGCSNLQHNIDTRRVQDSLKDGVDFLYFAGSQNSTFLRYLSDKKYFDGYRNIVLYLPYTLLKKSVFFNESLYHYKEVGCFSFISNVISHAPYKIVYTWDSYYDSIAANRKVDTSLVFVANKDPYIDSLTGNQTSYRNCNEAFVHKNHVIDIPRYSPRDYEFLKSILTPGQNIYIVFTPVPNIVENIKVITKNTENIKKVFKNIPMLNEPFVADSINFYDKWYHSNYCGKGIETANFINELRKKFQ